MNAAEEAYQYLEEENELILPIDEVGEPDIEDGLGKVKERDYDGDTITYNLDGGSVTGNPSRIVARNTEIEESNKFESLYSKVVRSLYDKNVIIVRFTT